MMPSLYCPTSQTLRHMPSSCCFLFSSFSAFHLRFVILYPLQFYSGSPYYGDICSLSLKRSFHKISKTFTKTFTTYTLNVMKYPMALAWSPLFCDGVSCTIQKTDPVYENSCWIISVFLIIIPNISNLRIQDQISK